MPNSAPQLPMPGGLPGGMPAGMPGGLSGAPGGAPGVAGGPAGAGSPPGTPPFGSSPLTMPVPNRGNHTGALALISNAIKQLEEALPSLAAEPEVGPALMKSLESLRKLIPEGAIPAGIQDAAQQRFMLNQRQQAPVLAALRAMLQQGAGAGGGAGGLPGAPGGGGPGGGAAGPMQPPAPPTPLPQ